MARLFGTDGVRGVANRELTPELAFKLGQAATALFGRENPRPRIVIGRDTRVSGQMLAAALAAGICSAGGDVILAGVIPTPAIAYLVRVLNVQAGVVISASHNPFSDNGIKFFSGAGYKLPDQVEDELERYVRSDDNFRDRPVGAGVGSISQRPELVNTYIDYVLSTVQADFTGLKIVVDCANGASCQVTPAVLRRKGAEVVVINDQPTGSNINDRCGSTHIDSLKDAVISHRADLGIAHDGDADRCLAVDETGQVVDGDQIMVICALALLNQGRLKDKTLVATVMSNIGLHKAIKQAGGNIAVTPVGDRYVLESMLANDYQLGGEQSGHIIFREFSTTGDGVITALQLISVLQTSGRKFSELAGIMRKFPQLLVNVQVNHKEGWEENEAIEAAIKAGEQQLGENGRIFVRPSGTEPLIRVMAEGPDQTELKAIIDKIAVVIKKEQS